MKIENIFYKLLRILSSNPFVSNTILNSGFYLQYSRFTRLWEEHGEGVYFDQHFLCLKAEKRKKVTNLEQNLSKKGFGKFAPKHWSRVLLIKKMPRQVNVNLTRQWSHNSHRPHYKMDNYNFGHKKAVQSKTNVLFTPHRVTLIHFSIN